MEKIIAGRHKHVNDHLKDFIYSELEKIESEYNKLTSGRVILDTQRNLFFTEVIIHGKNISIEAKSKGNDVHASIASAFSKANSQLRKFFDKLQDKHKKVKLTQTSENEQT
jgi:ribosomal subunit interface protein